MFCPQCRTANADLDRYCIACHADLGGVSHAHPSAQSAGYGWSYQPAAFAQYHNPQPLSPGTVPTYLAWSIIALLLCFWPTGVVAVVYASQVNGKLAVGDYEGALDSSHRARLWCRISLGVQLACLALVLVLLVGAMLRGA